MAHPFDLLDRNTLRNKSCAKWQTYDQDVLPLWVADMDYPIAEPIRRALISYAKGNNFGYPPKGGLPGVKEAALERLADRYGWQLNPEQMQLLNGIVPGLTLACLACAEEGDEVIVQSPIYPPFLSSIGDTGRVVRYNPLVESDSGWTIDFEDLERLAGPKTRLLMLCNPHNPTGRVFTPEELSRLASFALRHDLWIVSDELHSDLVYAGARHTPIASLNPEVGQRTLTLFGPTKTFNIAGLKIGFLASENAELLERVQKLARGLVAAPNVMAQAATIAAYREAGPWLADTLAYLQGNRDFISDFLARELPEVRFDPPEGTYLAWLDFRHLNLGDRLYEVLLDTCRVGLNDGPHYGPGGEGFTRLNFATSRAIVTEALQRIHDGLQAAARD
ncbi:MAG TPA: PatB family C-S lyase [Trueperaceae bacterium]